MSPTTRQYLVKVPLAVLFFLLTGGCAWASGAEANAAFAHADTVCMRLFMQEFVGGSISREIMQAGRGIPAEVKTDHGEKESLMRLVRALPLAEKCRFALMSLLSLNLDGDGAEMFGHDYLGSDQHAVGVALNRIPDHELMNTWPYQRCKDPARIRLFRALVNDWIAH